MVRCTGAGGCGSIAACKTKTDPSEPAGAPLSTACRPHSARPSIAAIADGATIDEITARIRAEGEDCSRSAVGRYAKNMRALIRQQQETDRIVKAWVQELGARPEGDTGLFLIETLRTMAVATMAALNGRDEPASLEELGRLSLILKRIEGTDKLRKDRERAAEKAKAEKAAEKAKPDGRGQAPGRPLGGDRRRHPRGGAGPAARASPARSRRRRWTRGIPNRSPQSGIIPANPT